MNDGDRIARIESEAVSQLTGPNFFRIGLGLTSAYLVIILAFAVYAQSGLLNMKPNEWGDFLAGIFGPLALLWVVLGFLQQGAELRYSRDALLLQARELRASVDAQNNMGEAAWEQVKVGRAAQAAQTESAIRAVAPILFVDSAGGGSSGGLKYTQLNVRNSGGAAFKVNFAVSDANLILDNSRVSTLPGDGHHTLTLTSKFSYPLADGTLTIECNDKLGLAHKYEYALLASDATLTIVNSFGEDSPPP